MRLIKRIMIVFFSLFAVICLAGFALLQHPKFGKNPTGKRLERIIKSPNYKDNAFANLSPTPMLAEGVNYFTLMKQFFFGDKKRKTPVDSIPSIKTDLLHLDSSKDLLFWFGHSSYFMQLSGKTFLVDPVFSGAASPFKFMVNAFKGTDRYEVEDFPSIDYLFITHDHWDHLDYETILKLKSKVRHVVCALGVGEHLEYWGFDKNIIEEMDWNEEITLEGGFKVNSTPARHFSGRGIIRNKSLWVSYVLQTPTLKLFIGGDSGYDKHFDGIGRIYGPFDLVILENGQYDKNWEYIHMLPDQVLKAAQDLRAHRLFPVHSSKFALANHNWDDPLKTITALNTPKLINIITPIIGEQVNLNDTTQEFTEWWKEVE